MILLTATNIRTHPEKIILLMIAAMQQFHFYQLVHFNILSVNIDTHYFFWQKIKTSFMQHNSMLKYRSATNN